MIGVNHVSEREGNAGLVVVLVYTAVLVLPLEDGGRDGFKQGIIVIPGTWHAYLYEGTVVINTMY